MITSIKCENCGRIFLYTFHSKSCLCGWTPSDETQKGIENVGKRKNKRKKKGSKMTNKTTPAATTGNSWNRNDSWEVEIDEVQECSKVPKEQKVIVDFFAKRKINALMKKYPSIEWLAYLMGDKETDPYTVKDIYIPQQKVTATTVDNIVCEEFNTLPIIGVIHSHHGMGNGFSGTDHEWINQNHNISLCISKGGIQGQVRMKTPCGALKIVKAVIKVKYPESDFDFDGWVEEETKKIEKKSYTSPAQSYYAGGYQNYAGRGWHQGRPGCWHRGVFYPEQETKGPSQSGGVPHHSSQPRSESQKQYSTGVAVVPPKDEKELASDDVPTIDEEMSLMDALNMIDPNPVVPTTTEVETVEVEEIEAKDDEWSSGLQEDK